MAHTVNSKGKGSNLSRHWIMMYVNIKLNQHLHRIYKTGSRKMVLLEMCVMKLFNVSNSLFFTDTINSWSLTTVQLKNFPSLAIIIIKAVFHFAAFQYYQQTFIFLLMYHFHFFQICSLIKIRNTYFLKDERSSIHFSIYLVCMSTLYSTLFIQSKQLPVPICSFLIICTPYWIRYQAPNWQIINTVDILY